MNLNDLIRKKQEAKAQTENENGTDTSNAGSAPKSEPQAEPDRAHAKGISLAAFAKKSSSPGGESKPKGNPLAAFARPKDVPRSVERKQPVDDAFDISDDDLGIESDDVEGTEDADDGAFGEIGDDGSSLLSITAADFVYPDQPDKYPEEKVTALRNAMVDLLSNIEDRDIIAAAMRNVLQMTRETPHLADLLLPDDFGAMSRALRLSYNVAITRVTEKKTKREAKTTKSTANMKDFEALLGDLEF